MLCGCVVEALTMDGNVIVRFLGGQTLIQWMSVVHIKNSDSKINNDEL